jgi:hypothetical protein
VGHHPQDEDGTADGRNDEGSLDECHVTCPCLKISVATYPESGLRCSRFQGSEEMFTRCRGCPQVIDPKEFRRVSQRPGAAGRLGLCATRTCVCVPQNLQAVALLCLPSVFRTVAYRSQPSPPGRAHGSAMPGRRPSPLKSLLL